MKCIILAAGYATRLYPLTENFPKPLLKAAGKTILDWIIEDLASSHRIDEFIVVSNHKFYDIFKQWHREHPAADTITILDDGSTANENRLGAVKDIAFAIDQCNVDEEIIVVAGDNLTDFSLNGFIDYFFTKHTTCIMRHYEPSVEKLHKTGVITINEQDKVLLMQEKPTEPASNWAVPPFYIYTKEDLPKIKYAIDNKVCNVDAPGDFICWLCTESNVHAYLMPGSRYDIGNLESYQNIQETYQGIDA